MPQPDPVHSDDALPRKTGVVVIGGGIIGTSTALELAERGIDVVLCEKGEIAGEQSSRNWGWCRQMGRDIREIPLILEAMKLWRGMDKRIGASTGYTECGIAYVSETEEEMAAREQWLDECARPYQLSSHIIDGDKVAELLPGSTTRWKGALYTPNDGRAEPQMAAPAIARAIRAAGGKVFTNCAVRGFETSAGKIAGVVTEKGPIACDNIVLAGGAWSRRFCGNANVKLKQLSVIGSVQRTAPIETGLETSFSGGRFAVRKRADGGYTVTHRHLSVADIVPASFPQFFDFLPALRMDWNGLKLRLGSRFFDEARLANRWSLDQTSPFEMVRTLDPEPIPAILDEALASLKAHYPVFDGIEITERWGGCIDATPDAVPVISAVDHIPGFHLATGFSGHGFGIGPGAGKLMAEIVTGATPCVDPEPFRYSRMVDGTRMIPMAGV
ncbi:MAG: FAD-binding oxidoreductase [Rhizobiales bacterium]|nr:FAD-binding oxidoreductase [Hyphomicrobiales bacterium]